VNPRSKWLAQAAKFKQAAVGVAAAPDPKTALAALRALLQQHSAAAAAGGGGGAGDALDLALDAPGLGDVLLRYATSTDTAAGAISVGDGARRGAGTTVQAPLPARLLRGLDLLKEGKPLDALDVFSAMLKPKEEAAAAGQPGAGLQRSLGLLMERKPLDALNAFSGMLKPKQAECSAGQLEGAKEGPQAAKASPAGAAASAAAELALLCCTKLEMPPLPEALAVLRAPSSRGSSGGGGDGAEELAEAARHLAAALATARGFQLPQTGPKPRPGTAAAASAPRPAPPPRASDARRVGEALAVLLHPAAAARRLPNWMLSEATAIVRKLAPSAMAPGAAFVDRAAAGGAGGRAAAAAARRRELERRAAGSPALEAVMKLTGLAAVKERMLQLRDEVSPSVIWGRCVRPRAAKGASAAAVLGQPHP
jgi:hypothetical protein